MHLRHLLSIGAALVGASLTLRADVTDEELAKSTLTKVGDPVPAFSGTTIGGESISAGQLKGKVVVLSLFATWCPGCIAELPHVEKELWQAFRARGLVVLAAARGEDADKLRPFAAKLGLTFQLVPDTDKKIFSQFATIAIPRLYVIGADGRIKFQGLDYKEDEFKVAIAIVDRELTAAAKP
jgi:peroxiredoxin